MPNSTPRLLVLGLDGMDPVVAGRLREEGRLPNLARLQDSSLRFELEPGDERYTGLAWEQFSSGLTPEEAGRWSAVSIDPRTYLPDQPTTRLPPFTARLEARTAVFDVPYFDLDRTDAAQGMVSWGSHDPGVARSCRPRELTAEIEGRFGDYPATEWIYGFVWPDAERTREMGRALAVAVEQRGEISRWLFGKRLPDWDLAITVVSEYHSAIEALWHGWDDEHPLYALPSAAAARAGLVAVYEAGDKLLGEMMDAFPDAAIMAFTLHGMGRNFADAPAMLLLPELLYRHYTGRRGFQADREWPADGTATPEPGSNWSGATIPKVRVGKQRFGRLRRLVMGSDRRERCRLDWMPAARYRSAWPRMKAYAMPAFYDARVRINLEGREGSGIVSPSEYEAALAEVVELIEACRDPLTGEPLKIETKARTDGDPLERNPTDADLVVRFHSDYYAFDHPRLGRIGPAPCRRPGGHTGGRGVGYLRTPDGRRGDLGRFPALQASAAVAALMGEQPAPGSLGEKLLRG